jgi:hypothetical protein
LKINYCIDRMTGINSIIIIAEGII